MSSLTAIMAIGQQGIFASLKSLQTTGANIANANTEGYSRQRTIYQPLSNLRGVRVQDIQRLRDNFLDGRRHEALNLLGFHSVKQQQINRIEGVLDETNQDGISAAFGDFFNSWQDLTLSPGGSTEREAVRAQGESLASVIKSNYNRLRTEQRAADNHVRALVNDVNSILGEIGRLNTQIVIDSASGKSINEMLDQRGVLLAQLQEKIPVNIIETSESLSGAGLAVFSTSGMPLIIGREVSSLSLTEDALNEGFTQVWVEDGTGVRQEMTSFITAGEMGGALDMRDNVIPAQLRWLDELTAKFVNTFNLQHRQGINNADIDFFEQLRVHTAPAAGNSMSGAVTGVVVDQSQLTFNEYEVEFFAGPPRFDIYEIQPNGSRVSVLGAPVAYADPTTVAFHGMSVTLSGPAAAGDVFRVNTIDRSASFIDLSAAVEASIDNIAAGNTANPGDNENALALVALEGSRFINASTIGEYLSTKVSNLGLLARQANHDLDTQDFIVRQLESYIEEVSGVSLDEESTQIIRYQRAYQAAAKIISTADQIYVALLDILR